MPHEQQQEKVIAELYDKRSSEFYDHHADRQGDIDFYVGSAVECGGAVLEIGCGTGHMANVVWAPDLNGMNGDLFLDFLQHIPYEKGSLGHGGLIKYLSQFRKRYLFVKAVPFLKEVINHLQDSDAKVHELISRVGEDKQLAKVF